jgi:GT2 family glycosyltransferase
MKPEPLLVNESIGVGLITCNSVSKFQQSAHLITDCIDFFVVVNDGKPYPEDVYPKNAVLIQHSENKGVAVSKNDALKFLMRNNCTHLFLIEDDVLIKNPLVFEAYIKAFKVSGLRHLNYALQGPHNRVQDNPSILKPLNPFKIALNQIYKLFFRSKLFHPKLRRISHEERHLLNENGPPDPRIVIPYSENVEIALYRHCVGAFSYYHRSVIEEVGYMDENFYNAWEHVEHTYQIAKKGLTSPFWWFADLANSENYIDNISECVKKSTIANSSSWSMNVAHGENYFKSKEGITFSEIPAPDKKAVLSILNQIQLNK